MGSWEYEVLGVWDAKSIGSWGHGVPGTWGPGGMGSWGYRVSGAWCSGGVGFQGHGVPRVWGPEGIGSWGYRVPGSWCPGAWCPRGMGSRRYRVPGAWGPRGLRAWGPGGIGSWGLGVPGSWCPEGMGSWGHGSREPGVLGIWGPGHMGSWGYEVVWGAKSIGSQGHGVLSLWDPGDTGAWTHGVQGDLCTGDLGHPVSWPQEAADTQCSRHRGSWAGGVTPPCLPWQGPAWPTPVLGSPPAHPPRVAVARGWRWPEAGSAPQPAPAAGSHVCAHTCLLRNSWLSLLSRIVTFACSPSRWQSPIRFWLRKSEEVVVVWGGARHCCRPRTTDCLPRASAVLWPSNARVEVTAMCW